jgi:integrase
VRGCRDRCRQALRRLGHAKITTTLDIYTHLFPDDDASGDMAALEAMSAPVSAPNVVPLLWLG